jgi:hypothetical protein
MNEMSNFDRLELTAPARRTAALSTATLCDERIYSDHTRDVLRAIRGRLPAYRASLEKVWSRKTIHPAYIKEYRPMSSLGQCGVSSAWLVHKFWSDFEVAADYCYGSLFGKPATIPSHCWIELEVAGIKNIIDLTADQADGLYESVLFELESTLRENEIRYECRTRTSLGELQYDPVWPRLRTLSDRIDTSLEEIRSDDLTYVV